MTGSPRVAGRSWVTIGRHSVRVVRGVAPQALVELVVMHDQIDQAAVLRTGCAHLARNARLLGP